MKQIYEHKTNPILKQTSTWNINHKLFSLLDRPQTKLDFINIFMIQNKGKGPPGRTRSPGMAYCPTRDNQPAFERASHIELPERVTHVNVEGKNPINNEYQLVYKKQISNFLTQLNFLNMKKQILFLAFFVLAALASMTTAYGQATHQSNPIPLGNCSDDPLHPVPGRAYTYGVTATPAGANTYTWWATKDFNFIKTVTPTVTTNMIAPYLLTVAGGDLIATDTNYAPSTPSTSSTVSITWSAPLLAGTASGTVTGKTPTFVVVQVDDATNCTNNFKVYQLDPIVAFTVDILPMDLNAMPTGNYSATISDCFDKVASATFNAGSIAYDYGTNVLYYEVVASNFTDWFNTNYKLDGLQVGQTADVAWSYGTTTSATYTDLATGLVGTGSIIDVGTTAGATASATAAAGVNTSLGVSIYVRVTIHNGSYEGLVDSPIALSVEGKDAEGNADKDNATCVVPGTTYEDVATQTLNLRPTVAPNSPPSAPDVFVPKLP